VDPWFEAYRSWPPMNQLTFSVVLLMAGVLLVVLLMLAGYQFVFYVAVWVRGWPPVKTKDDPTRPTWADVREFSKLAEAYRRWEKERAVRDAQAAKDAVTPAPPPPPPEAAPKRRTRAKKGDPPLFEQPVE
jgi:hypothetical protein